MNKRWLALSLAALMLLLSAGQSWAVSSNVGVKAGFVADATLDFADKKTTSNTFELETNQSWSVQGFVELPLHGDFHSILALDYNNLGDIGKSEMLLVASYGVRYNWETNHERFAIRPGLALGYGYLGDTHVSDAAGLLTLNLSSEFVIYSTAGTGFMFETGLLWALTGGNESYDIDGGPLLQIRGGLRF